MTVRHLLVAAALVGSLASAQPPANRPAGVSFGVIADVQYADKNTAGARHYRSSLDRLKACVADLNQRDLKFVIQLGDFIDTGKDSFDAVLPIWKKLKAPRRNVLGNHDLPFARKRALDKLGLKRGYYDFTLVEGWRFVVLDGMDVSLHGYPKGHPKRKQALQMLVALKRRKVNYAQRWNGGVGEKQLAWLERTLADSVERRQRVVVCCHFPILAKASSDSHLLWNHEAVLKVIEQHPSVVAWFNGHDHAGGYSEHNGIHHVTFSGMVEAPKRNAYSVVTAFDDRLELRGVGKQPSRTLRLRAVPDDGRKHKTPLR
ncbi:MAG: hypothetical protein CMJ83_17625 [Planctomycetes bacterium]|nr:hypothetical protein [Planctomycetota bacterium]